jgi:hypothetical protein
VVFHTSQDSRLRPGYNRYNRYKNRYSAPTPPDQLAYCIAPGDEAGMPDLPAAQRYTEMAAGNYRRIDGRARPPTSPDKRLEQVYVDCR